MAQNLQDDIWRQISNAIDEIYSSPVESLTPARYMELHNLVHDYMANPSLATRHGRIQRATDFYLRLQTYLREKMNNAYRDVYDMLDTDHWRLYKVYWNNYKKMCGVVNGVCHRVNRELTQSKANSDIYNINKTQVFSQELWERTFFQPLFPRITHTCLDLIQMARKNPSFIDSQSIQEILQLYTDKDFIQIIKADPQFESINDIYTECFHNEFLRGAQNFYHQDKIPSFKPDQMLEYLTSIATYFHYEINFAQSCLPKDKSTSKNLIDILEELFLPEDIFNIILEKIKPLIWDADHYIELARLYEPISQIPKINNQLKLFVEDYIHQMGSDAIQRLDEIPVNNFKVYIETIFDIYKTFFKPIQDIFHNEEDLITVLDQTCVKFINKKIMTEAAGNINISAEFLARYCDVLLRKRDKAVEETDLEEKFNQIMIVFNYVEDKDVYQKFYGKMLAKRLVGQLSASDDYEESMISKLKQACGFEYTSKLQRMFQDIGVSKTLIVEYEKYCESNQVTGIVDFSVMVLSSNSWPFSASPNFALPIELKSTFDSFTDFYTHRHNGRKLTWLHQHSKGELQTFFTSQKYILKVSTYQMVVLLLFNKVLTWTVERIQDETQIKSELLLQILFGLLKSKLLVCTDINEDEIDEDFKETDIKTNYSIRLSTDFTSKKRRINLNVPLKSVEQKDIEDVHLTIDEDRKMVIQAAIVRIMKARQTLKHSLLMQEVIQQLSSHFQPNISVIKKCIDILIEKEYLERQSNEKDVLRYSA